MARTDTLSILASAETKDKLKEITGKVIETIQKDAISSRLKNVDYSGDPTSGSVEVPRFNNATVDDYGTARAAGKGKSLINGGKVVINLDQDKELTTEIEFKDLQLYGVEDLLERRTAGHGLSAAAHLDRKFFEVAEAEGTAVTPTATETRAIIDEMLAAAESTKNDWVDGIDREALAIVVKPEVMNEIRDYVDSVDGGSENGTTAKYHGAEIYSNFRQTADIIVMAKGALAQPLMLNDYEAEKIPLSESFVAETFLHYGTKAVAPDLVWTYTEE